MSNARDDVLLTYYYEIERMVPQDTCHAANVNGILNSKESVTVKPIVFLADGLSTDMKMCIGVARSASGLGVFGRRKTPPELRFEQKLSSINIEAASSGW